MEYIAIEVTKMQIIIMYICNSHNTKIKIIDYRIFAINIY